MSKQITLGEVVMVSDPCYTEPTWCQKKLDNVKPGIYNVGVDKKGFGDWGNRVHKLVAIHEDYFGREIKWKLSFGTIGVDSGQAGIFDYPTYRKDGLIMEVPESDFVIDRDSEGDDWYEKMCKFTLSNESWGLYDNGVVCSSGIGDGAYDLFVMEDEGKVVGMMVEFLPDEDEEEDDWDEEEDD